VLKSQLSIDLDPVYSRRYDLRFIFVFLLFIIGLLVFAGHLVLLQFLQSSHLASLAEKQQNHLIEIEPVRGAIYDRRLRPMAFNVAAYSLFANPKMMKPEDKRKAIYHLSELLELDPAFIQERLNRNKYFVWIKRKLSVDAAKQIRELKIRGLEFKRESRRHYPNGELASHIIGFSSVDNEGLEGMELVYNSMLKGKPGQMYTLRDARHNELMIEKDIILPTNGSSMMLTIDETIQYIAEHALRAAFTKHHAKSASIIVMDVKTGEILAMANQPTYNLEHAASSNIESRTNRVVSFVYEPGSVFKVITAAAALEEGVFTEQDKVFCENGSYKVANNILHDHHPHGTLTFREVFEMSSNIGVTKIAQKLTPGTFYKYAKRFRFGTKTGIDLKGEVNGLLKPPSVWSKTSIGAIPIGQEVTVTPLQMLGAMAAIANGGAYMQPYIVKTIKDNNEKIVKSVEPKILDHVISPETARRVTEILVGVTEKGTGKAALIKGMRVAGKTGTSQKVVDGKYSHSQFFASFCGFAPADNPRLAAIVVVEEPRPSYFGGTVAAPVFKEVIENSLKYLDVSGDSLEVSIR